MKIRFSTYYEGVKFGESVHIQALLSSTSTVTKRELVYDEGRSAKSISYYKIKKETTRSLSLFYCHTKSVGSKYMAPPLDIAMSV
jgi:hypothetical protein